MNFCNILIFLFIFKESAVQLSYRSQHLTPIFEINQLLIFSRNLWEVVFTYERGLITPYHPSLSLIDKLMDGRLIKGYRNYSIHTLSTLRNILLIPWHEWNKLFANEKGTRCILLVIARVLFFTKNSIRTSFELFM